jgi:hypothetical protein
VHPRHANSGGCGEVFEPAGRGVAIHPGAEGVAQDRAGVAAVDGGIAMAGTRSTGGGL